MRIIVHRNPGPFRSEERYRCPECARPLLAPTARRRSARVVFGHRRPTVAGRPLRFDADLDVEQMITGEPVVLVPCHERSLR